MRGLCVFVCVRAHCMSRWHECALVHGDLNQQLLQPCQTRLYDPPTMNDTGNIKVHNLSATVSKI